MDSQVYAGFFVRLSAYLIDWMIVGAALMLIRIPIWIINLGGAVDWALKDFIFQYSVYDIVLYLLKIAYFVLLTYFTGSTIGKRLLQIRVVSVEDRKPTFFEIAFRESVGKFLSAMILYIGYILIGGDKRKRGLHDILSDTYVVYQHKKVVAIPAPISYNTVQYTMPRTQVPPYQAGAAGGKQFTMQNSQQYNQMGKPQNWQSYNQADAMGNVQNQQPYYQAGIAPDIQSGRSCNQPGVQQNAPQGNQSNTGQKIPQQQSVKAALENEGMQSQQQQVGNTEEAFGTHEE